MKLFSYGTHESKISADDGSIVAHIFHNGFDDATSIAKRMIISYNSHDKLVKALEGMVGAWNMVCDAHGWERDHIQQQKDAIEALAAAKGE